MLSVKKTYYSISEVCLQTGLEPHVLRYWESEFPQLRPKKNRAGNRAYRDKDIQIIRYIKHLLYEEQFTIPGAKKKLSESRDIDSEQLKLDLIEPPAEIETPQIEPNTDPVPETELSIDNNDKIESIRIELQDILKIIAA